MKKMRKQNSEFSYLYEKGEYKKIGTKFISKKLSEIYANNYHWFNMFQEDINTILGESIYSRTNQNHLRSIFLLDHREHKRLQKKYGSLRYYVILILEYSLNRAGITEKAKIRLEKVLEFYNDESNFIIISESEYNENKNVNSKNIAKHLSIIFPISLQLYTKEIEMLHYFCCIFLIAGLTVLLFSPLVLIGIVFFSLFHDVLTEKEFYFDFFYGRKADSFGDYIFLSFTLPIFLILLWLVFIYPFLYFKSFHIDYNAVNLFVILCVCFWILPFVIFMSRQHNYIVALSN